MYRSDMPTEFVRDPVNIGWVQGFGVFRMAPWHFAGLFHTREEAQRVQQQLGQTYEVGYGSHRDGSDDFIVDER